ncbi:MAG: nitroreductase family protein [Candidatus Izemoplasmatales bacterium]
MDDREAIFARISRRSYRPDPLDAATDAKICDLVAAADRDGGLFLAYVKDRPDLFGGIRKTYGLLSGVRNFIVLAGAESDPDAAEKCGYFGERVVLELTKLGLGTCWVGGSFDRGRVGELLAPGRTLFGVITLGKVDAAFSPRERLVRFSTHLRASGEGRFHRTDGTEPDWFFEAVARLALAPSAVNRRPVFLNVEHGVVRAVLRIRDAFTPIDLGIAKFHVATAFPDGVWEWGDGGRFLNP